MSSAKRLFLLGLNVLTPDELVSSWRSAITWPDLQKCPNKRLCLHVQIQYVLVLSFTQPRSITQMTYQLVALLTTHGEESVVSSEAYCKGRKWVIVCLGHTLFGIKIFLDPKRKGLFGTNVDEIEIKIFERNTFENAIGRL